MDAARAQRAAALESKKKRLEQLKARQRERGTSKPPALVPDSSSNLDEYIDGLLKSIPAVPGVITTPVTLGGVGSDSVSGKGSVDGTKGTEDGGASETVVMSNLIPQKVGVPLIAQKREIVTFAMSTQTEDEDFPVEQEQEIATEENSDKNKNKDDAAVEKAEKKDNRDSDYDDMSASMKFLQPKILSKDEVEKEVQIPSFGTFLSTASKKVERVLGAPLLADLLVNYVGETDTGNSNSKRIGNKASHKHTGRFVASRQLYECQKWTKHRDVTDVAWSHLHRELFLSTYSHPSTTAHGISSNAMSAIGEKGKTSSASATPRTGELQSDGLALVWNLSMPNRPEHIFTCGSPVTTGRFHPTESSLVIGACQSGQLVVWDVRAGRLPVQRSSLTAIVGASKSHTHPICSMEVIEGGSGLVTADTNGKVNFWSIGNLREPAESIQINDSLSCLTLAPETDALIFGDGNGGLQTVQASATSQGQRSSRRTVKKFIDPNSIEDDSGSTSKSNNKYHYGLVTAISAKTIPSGASSRSVGLSKGFLRGSGGLLLSSGVDWCVKLWAPAYNDQPLMSWVSHSYDYMSDVQWSPAHPSLFATASSNGTLGLWNLASSLEEPITGSSGILIESDSESGATATPGLSGLNKIKWSLDGRRLLVASGNGRVHVLGLSEEVLRQKGDEDARIMGHLISRGLLERE